MHHYTTDLEGPVLESSESRLSRRYLRLLEGWIPFALNHFHSWDLRPRSGHFFQGVLWYGAETIQPVFVIAAAVSSSEYDERVTGIGREELAEIAVQGFRYACFTHDTGPADCVRPDHGLGSPDLFGTKWGERGKGFFRESQCGRNIAKLVISAILLRPWLDDESRLMLAAICSDYLERFADMAPRSGVYFDTQAEENAWTAEGLAACRLFLGRHPDAESWEQSVRRWLFAAATAPADMRDHAPVGGGQTVREWCERRFTLLPDGMAENHGMVHPTYTGAAFGLAGWTANLYRLFGVDTPDPWLWHRRREVYENLKRLSDRRGMLHPPQGMDWPYLTPPTLPGIHCFARIYFGDPDAAMLEEAALGLAEAIIKGNGGRMYDPAVVEHCTNQQDPMLLWECKSTNLVPLYLAHRLSPEASDLAPTPLSEFEMRYAGVRNYPHSGFVFHRHPKGQTSVSWRNEVMALPLEGDGLLTVAPSFGSILGEIVVSDRAQNRRLVSHDVHDQRDGFVCTMRFSLHEGSITQEVVFASLPDGRSVVHETFTVIEGCTIESISQGKLEIMNETFPEVGDNCVGARTLYTSESADSADRFPSLVRPNADDDLYRVYDAPSWLNLDGRLGFTIASTDHRTVYHNRHSFTPFHAVTDELVLNRVESSSPGVPGSVAAELIALIAPGDSPEETSRRRLIVASQAESGTVAYLADTTLVVASPGARSGRYTFEFPERLEGPHIGSDRPVAIYPGVTTRIGSCVTCELELVAGGGRFFEPVGLVRANGPVMIECVASDRCYLTNEGTDTVECRLGDQTIAVPPATTVLAGYGG